MKKLIMILAILFCASSAFAHGYPTAEEFQMFPESIISQPLANVAKSQKKMGTSSGFYLLTVHAEIDYYGS